MKKQKLIIGISAICLFFINDHLITWLAISRLNSYLSSLDHDSLINVLVANQTDNNVLLTYYYYINQTMFYIYLTEAVVISFLFKKRIKKLLNYLTEQYKTISIKLLKYVISMTIVVVLVYIFMYLFGLDMTNIGANQSLINSVLLNDPNIYIFLVVGLVAPCIEEFIFRFGLIGNLLTDCSNVVKIIISTIVFTLIHTGFSQFDEGIVISIQLLLLYMPMAALYSYIYVREKRIIYPLGLHIINNIASIIFVYIIAIFI